MKKLWLIPITMVICIAAYIVSGKHENQLNGYIPGTDIVHSEITLETLKP